jgi:multimeric flavodoxin WrbA
MRYVTIYGGPRPQGNTETVLGWVEDALTEAGHEVSRFDVARLNVGGCTSCYACFESSDAPGCVVDDDAGAILDAMITSDGIVFASPLYMWGISGQLKSFLDRTVSLVRDYLGPNYSSLVEGKRSALIVTCMGPEENNSELAVSAFTRWARYAKLVSLGAWVVAGCSEPSALSEEIRRGATDLAARLAS